MGSMRNSMPGPPPNILSSTCPCLFIDQFLKSYILISINPFLIAFSINELLIKELKYSGKIVKISNLIIKN